MKNLTSSFRQFLLDLVFICCLVAVDLAVKALIRGSYQNYRFAFSLPLPSTISVSIAVVLIILAAVWLCLTPPQRLLRRLGLVLVVSGGTANTLERVYRGFVTDLIHLPRMSINLADIYIFIGLIVLLVSIFLAIPTPKRRHSTLSD